VAHLRRSASLIHIYPGLSHPSKPKPGLPGAPVRAWAKLFRLLRRLGSYCRRSALLRARLRQQGIIVFDSYPGTCSSARATRLGTVPGYYQSSRAARDWIALLELVLLRADSLGSYEVWMHERHFALVRSSAEARFVYHASKCEHLSGIVILERSPSDARSEGESEGSRCCVLQEIFSHAVP
jgi:hypothetical protein